MVVGDQCWPLWPLLFWLRDGAFNFNFCKYFPHFQTYQNTGYLLNIMLLFDRCLNSGVVTPARFHYDSTWSYLLWQNQNCPNREIINPGWIPAKDQGADSVLRCHLTSIGILFIKIWQSHDHLIFIKEIAIVLIKTTFLSSAASSAPDSICISTGVSSMLHWHRCYWHWSGSAVRCHGNVVNFLRNPHNRYPKALPIGQAMGCRSWVQILIYEIAVLSYCSAVSNIMLYWNAL